MKAIVLCIILALIVISCGAPVKAIVTVDKTISDGIDTAYNELKPSELLRKYEWFKDAIASLDKKKADIQIYEKS